MSMTKEPSRPADLEQAILDLKKEKGAVVLAHFYQESEIQDLADVVGDSLALARAALWRMAAPPKIGRAHV